MNIICIYIKYRRLYQIINNIPIEEILLIVNITEVYTSIYMNIICIYI